VNAGLFLDGLLGDEPRKTGWMRAEAAGDPGPWRQQALATKPPNKSIPKKTRRSISSAAIQEIRRVAQRLARRRIDPAYVIAWSLWRREHQAVAQKFHLKQKSQL
jgi:hypothetical protein